MFKEMGISQENALKYIKDWAWGKKALNGTTGNSIETDTTDSATNLNDSAIPMPSSNSESGHVFIPKEAWERFNQTGEYSDIKTEPVLSTGEVMISKRDFDILKNNAPSFVESIKDNIRDSAGGITKRENSQNSITLGEQEDDISNWNSPRNKALYNNFFEQFREAGYTRGQSRALAQMTLDHVIKRSIDTGIAPEDVVKINIKNRKIIRDDEIAESEYFNQTLNFDNDLNVNIDSDMLKNLETAKTMLKDGEDSDTIKLKTGWEVKNGKLFYDASAEKTPQEIDRLNKLNALKSMIRDLDEQTGIYKSEAVREANRKFNNGTIDLFEHAEEVEKARRSNPAYNDIFRQIDELNNSTDNQVATLKNFKQTFDKLDRGRIFVRIPDMRKELNWPREVFDNMLMKLRDEGVIALHVGDTSLMTPDEVENSFVDENGFRMGTVTWENNNIDLDDENLNINLSQQKQQQQISDPIAALASDILDMSKILNDGKTSYFLPIDELRDAFNSRGFDNETFDFLLENLRDNGIIGLRQGDESIAGAERAAKFFTDSNGFTFGTFSVENINALMEAVQNAITTNEEVISQPNIGTTPVTTQTDEISEPKLRKLNEDEIKPVSDSLHSALEMVREKKTSKAIKKATGWEKISDEEWRWTGKNDRNQDVKAAYFPRGNEHRKTKDKLDNSLKSYNKAQFKAILEAPAGTKIHQVHHAFATTESDLEIVMRGTSEKSLVRVNKNGSHNRSKKLSRQLLNEVFFNSEATLFYPIAKTAEEIAKDEADLFKTLELSMKQNDVDNTESQVSELTAEITQNIQHGTEAMNKVISDHVDVENAMHRDDIGYISFLYGTPGTGAKLKHGWGISHLIARRNQQGFNGEEIAKKMVEVIAKGEITRRYGQNVPNGERLDITYDDYTAILSLYKDKEKLTWLLTGFKNENPVATSEGNGSSSATLNSPMRTRTEEGAGNSVESLAFNGTTVNAEQENINASNINKDDAVLPQKGKIIKGRASWEKDVPMYEQTALIELSEKHKDPTTIIEELGHYFLQWDIDALRFGGKETLKEDIDEVMKFAGVTFEDYQNDTDGAREKVQEAYAKEFIKYVATGEAPNSRLKRAFQRFKAWMFDLFRDIQRRNVHVNENMRRVFDNLFTNQKKVDYSAKIKDFAIEAAALKNEISRAEAMLRERAERESAYAEMMEDTLPEISKNALQNVSEYLMNQIRFVSDQLKYNDDVLRIANTIKSLGGLRYQDIEQAIEKPLAQDLRKKWPSLFRKQQGNEQLPLDTLVQQFEDSELNFHNNDDLINWLTDTNNEKPKPVAPLIEINTDNLNALIDVLGIEETKNYVKTRKNYVNKLTKAAEAELDKSKIKVSDAEIDIAELEWTMKTSKGKGKSSKINAKLKKANEALKKAKSDYALAQKDVQELYKEQTEISDSLDFINRVLNADGEAIGIENEAAEKPTAEKTNKPVQQKQLLTLSEAMKKGYQMADRYYKEGVNTEKELEQIRLDRMEDRFEAKIDRLKKHLNRDQIRIEKLRSRLEEIGKIKPEINRIVKSINSMKNKINIRYGRKKEIEELLSKYDLKRRSKNVLSHRDDVAVFLRAYPESIEQMTEPEDLEALKLAGKINIGNMTLGELRALENKVEEIYDKGEREYKEWKTAKDETRKKIREDLEKSLNKKSVSKSGVPTKRKDLEKQYKGVSGKLDKIKDWNSATLRTPDRVADILDGGGAKYNGAWEKHLIEEPREKINEAERHIHERKDKMEQELAKLGLKLVDFSKALTKLDDKTFTVDEVIELYLGMRNPKKAKAILFGNFVNRLNCSPEEAQNMINELTSHLTENHKKAAELIIADHEANKERINQSLIDARNEGMNFESDYTSVHRLEHRTNGGFIDVNDEEVIRNGMNEAGILQRIDNGFAINRQNISDQNQTPIQLGAFSNWLSDISKQENSAALNETASNLMSALLSKGENGKTLLQTISDKFGDQMKKAVVSIFNDTFTDNRRIADEFLRGASAAASRNMSVAYIAGNIGVYVMQATSYPLFLPFARPDYLFTSIFEFLQNPDEFLENVYQLSPSMRVTGGDPIDRAFLDSINNTKWQSSTNKLLQPASQIDNITKSMGWWAVYKTNLKRGVPHEKAIREADKAVRLTQPPSSAKDTMRIARSGGLAALKMKFTSATAAFWNLTTYDFVQQLTRNGMNGVKSAFYTALGLGLTAIALKMMHDGGPKEEEGQSIPEWIMEAFIDQFIGSWPLIGKDAMYAYNKHFRGKWGQPQIDAFSAPISKAFEALGILMKEDKEDKDWMKALSLGAEVTALTTGKIPYAGIKQALRSIILFGNGDPLGGILNSIGFRQKASGE